MGPLVLVLLVFGYGLALPALGRLPALRRSGHRLGLLAHQIGMMLATAAWLIGARWTMALLHLAWLIGVRIWFGIGTPTKHS